jgi:hypothetical protein
MSGLRRANSLAARGKIDKVDGIPHTVREDEFPGAGVVDQLVLEEELRHVATVDQVEKAGIRGVAHQHDLGIVPVGVQ